jgi:hypothetical protein
VACHAALMHAARQTTKPDRLSYGRYFFFVVLAGAFATGPL